MSDSFRHLAAPLRLFAGVECLDALAREMGRLGCKRAMIVCGGSLSRNNSTMALVKDALGQSLAGVFDKVQAHSPIPSVQAAARELARVKADAIVALGGGSAIVSARAANILHAEGEDPRRLCTHRDAQGRMTSPRLDAPKLPQFVLPTTPTTAAVKAGTAVWDEQAQERLAMFDPKTRAQAIFIHPALVGTAPAALVLSAALNTFAMAVEGLESAEGNPIADAQLMHALRLIAQHLPLEGNDNSQARCDLVTAAVLCGQGTDFGGAGLASVLGHAIGARHHVENGIANAIVLPHTMRFNALATGARAAKIAVALGIPGATGADDAISAVEAFLSRLSVPHRLRDAGIPRQAIPEIARHAMGDWFLQKNPRRVQDPHELEAVLQHAW